MSLPARRLVERHPRREVRLTGRFYARVADDPEFRSAFVADLEWGSRLAVLNSPDGVAPVRDQPMPSWGWGEVGGPYRG